MVAAGALPGGGFDQHLLGYGGTARTPLEEAPSRAAVISHEAQVDGVNPYTNEALSKRSSAHHGYGPSVLTNGGVTRTLSGRQSEKAGPMYGADPGETGQPTPTPLRVPEAAVGGGPGVHRAAVVPSPAGGGVLSSLDTEPVQEKQANGVVPTSAATTRPTSGKYRNDSVPTISHLHIPGEFPKGAPTS